MDSSNTPTVVKDFSPFIKIYVERLMGTAIVPPSLDDSVQSKDVVYSPETNLSSRLYLPKINDNEQLPLLIYYHGGAFLIETAFSPTYHNYLNTLVAEANVIVVSVDYRRAPEDPIPAAYDDSWTALNWVASHFNGDGPEEWLNLHADFSKVYLAGDSAGANITHYLAMRYGQQDKLLGGGVDINIIGIVLVHPYFWGEEPIGDELKNSAMRSEIESFWRFTHPIISLDHPLVNPPCDPNFGKLGCNRVLVFVAGKDILKDRGWYYYDTLKNSSQWDGVVEIMEAKEEGHVFHLSNPTCDDAVAMLKKISSFLNQVN